MKQNYYRNYLLVTTKRLGVSVCYFKAVPMRFKEQKLGKDFLVIRRHIYELLYHECSQTSQFVVPIITRCIENLLKYAKQLRLHQHHGHVQIYSNSMEKRDCTFDFAVIHCLPRLKAPCTSTNNFWIEQTAMLMMMIRNMK